MLSGHKILVTGVTGQVASPIAASLAQHNEVWGLARFAEAGQREAVHQQGIRPCTVDLAGGDFSALPSDFDYVLHFAFTRGHSGEFDRALRVNAEGTGLLLHHCRSAKAALVVSSAAIYTPHDDPLHTYAEEDDLGRALAPWSPTSPVSKIAEESVARFCARAFGLPVTIARLHTVYGGQGHLPALHLRAIAAGQPVALPCDPNLHSPIHVDDMAWQLESLLGVAGVPALVVNWAGDEPVTAQHWCQLGAQQLGLPAHLEVRSLPGVPKGCAADVTRRRAITGPCTRSFDQTFVQGLRAWLA